MHTREMCDSCCFSEAITVTRTRLGVHCVFVLTRQQNWGWIKLRNQQRCVITGDAESLSPSSPTLFKEHWSHSSFSRYCAPNTKSLAIAEDLHALHVGFQHSIFYCSEYQFILSNRGVFRPKTEIVEHINS